ncbi:piggyBac transposable element-derived protein 4-like [Anthonomus grandis grandis]|uniref:piggyBac transposable element-derived protein 4-like n=1 Tax=Anthonomus grandis grandis TaxID=2921223 RepID=UPI0021665AC2|nr:piggyBac transposable element-derived protein 4-like [Anthonomus grandis grandis]
MAEQSSILLSTVSRLCSTHWRKNWPLFSKMSQPKRLRDERSKDPMKWLQWYNEMEEDESEPEENESESDNDFVYESEHDTDSEQGADEESLDDEDEGMLDNDTYLAKDGMTRWRKGNFPLNVRTRACNIITHLPGPRKEARELKSEIDIYNLFLDEDIIGTIVESTNIYIQKVRAKFGREKDARETDALEARAFIGLLYLIGSLRCSKKNFSKLWDNSKGNSLESCYLCMSERRFRFLLKCLRFDDIRDREQRKALDKLAPVQKIMELFNKNCQKYFCASEYLTVDEQLLSFRGRCSFRQYIPSKPAKYGLKVFALVDSKTAYRLNLEPYVGKQPDRLCSISNAAEDIVLRLVEPVRGTNRNITGDNWFSSLSLAKKLQSVNLTYVGTMRQNKREIPEGFLPNKSRQINLSIFGFQKDCSLVSYCPKKGKAVLILSTMHFDGAIDASTGEALKAKSNMVTFYNMTKVGVQDDGPWYCFMIF